MIKGKKLKGGMFTKDVSATFFLLPDFIIDILLLLGHIQASIGSF